MGQSELARRDTHRRFKEEVPGRNHKQASLVRATAVLDEIVLQQPVDSGVEYNNPSLGIIACWLLGHLCQPHLRRKPKTTCSDTDSLILFPSTEVQQQQTGAVSGSPFPPQQALLLQERRHLSLTLEVNSTRDPSDALSGTEEVNVAPDGVLIGGWGGLGGHVWLEARGSVWMVDPFVRPRLHPLPSSLLSSRSKEQGGDEENRFAVLSRVDEDAEDLFTTGLVDVSADLAGESAASGPGNNLRLSVELYARIMVNLSEVFSVSPYISCPF